jgi:hypothetical protein
VTIDNQPSDPPTLVDELRQLIGLRSRQSVRDRAFPQLFLLLADRDRTNPDVRFTALTRLLDDAVARIGDPAHRHAAAALVGSGPGRWRTVTQRGTEAAAAFGCGWDAYRRKRASGPSQLDDTLGALVCALHELAGPRTPSPVGGAARPPGRGATQAEPAPVARVVLGPTPPSVLVDPPPPPVPPAPTRAADGSPDRPPPARRRGDVVTIGLVALALVTGGAVAWSAARSDRPAATTAGPDTTPAGSRSDSCVRLTHRVGDVDPAGDDELAGWGPIFRSAAADLPGGVDTCAGLLTHELDLVLQPISDGSPLGVGALVGVDAEPRRTVLLHHSEYWTYRNHVLSFGSGIGAPLGRADQEDGTWVVKLTQGAIVGGPYEQARLVSDAVFATWMQRGGVDGEMGLPVAPQRDLPGVGKVQDFQRGRITVDFLDPTVVTWTPVPNPGGLLPPQIEDRVVVADDGTSWWIDGGGVRHWIPTNNDFGCASALSGSPQLELPIIAIATLETGEPSRCR